MFLSCVQGYKMEKAPVILFFQLVELLPLSRTYLKSPTDSRVCPPPQKGLLYVWESSNWYVCKSMSQEEEEEEELSVPLLASQNTNWIVKAEQLLFGNAVINRVSYILWSIVNCQWNSMLDTKSHSGLCCSRPRSLPLRSLLGFCTRSAFVLWG